METFRSSRQAHRRAQILCSVALAAICSGCSARPNPNIERVQADLATLKSDPAVLADPTIELNEAEQAVSRAQTHWNKTRDSREAEHLSYLADKRIEIARLKTAQHIAESNVTQLSRARDIASVNAQISEDSRVNARAAMSLDTPERYELRIDDPLTPSHEITARLDEFQANRGRRDLRITLGDHLFESDGVDLKSDSFRSLSSVAAFIRHHPMATVTLRGYSDGSGSETRDLEFSRGRAWTVNRYLVGKGVYPEQLVTESLGSRFPLEPSDRFVGSQQNRRVEILFSRPR